jgi:hypothetical protein
MFDGYVSIFSQVAKHYRAYVVAGSTFLPRLWIDKETGNVTLTDQGLFNVGLTFDPQGKAVLATYKTHLVPAEHDFIDAASVSELSSFEAPASSPLGRLGVLICADSWFPECYEALKLQGQKEGKEGKIDVVAVPALLEQGECWERPWQGYTVVDYGPPKDYEPQDVGRLTESQAWEKYALGSRLGRSFSQPVLGACCFLGGSLWNFRFGGQSLLASQTQILSKTSQGGIGELLFHRQYNYP